MSVKKEPSGRRSVQVEVEVPGTPEEVWQAIATGPGISSWMVPTEFEERDGKPVAVKMNFGPGMEIRPRRDGLGTAAKVGYRVRWRSLARRRSRTSGALKRARGHLHRPHSSRACSPARTIGTTSWKPARPHGLRSSAPCGSISRTSAANARRSCSSWSLLREPKRRPGNR